MPAQSPQHPLVFGEVLFDCFPDGTQVLGGAPFNVAWNLHGLGVAPFFISRVGLDVQGQRVLAAMEDWGMDCRGVQRDAVHPTGRVEVTLKAGQPSYDILLDQAYDFIKASSLVEQLGGTAAPLLYRGTLAVRSPTSRHALETLSRVCNPSIFLDVNLRSPWWQLDSVIEALQAARWAKLSEAELFTVLESEAVEGEEELMALAQLMCRRFQLEWVLVTLGDKGALLVTAGGKVHRAQSQPITVVDTVGAGDAFSAVMILALLSQWPLSQALVRGTAFASAVCQMRGAVSCAPEFYHHFRASWQEAP
jgi:fructokinase